MRCGTLKKYEQKLARGAAILVVGGLAAGCSSQVDRFSESLLTGSSYPRAQRTASLAEQPYPGDTSYANLDRTPTGSVGERVVRPDVPVGGGGMTTGNTQAVQPLPAPSTAAPVGGVRRGSISSAPLAPVTTSNVPAQSRLAPVSGASQPAANVNNAARATASTSNKTGTRITVRPGDTVYNLSRRFGVPQSAIVAANGLSSASALQAGQTIVIPAYTYSETVQGSQPDAGKRANALPAPSKPGQPPVQQKQERVAVLPRPERSQEEQSSASLDADRPEGQVAATGSVYTVASGDTLYGISRKTGVSVADLKAANGLSNGYIRVGQQLKLSASAASAPVDKVKTATVKEPESTAAKQEKIASYTPPKKTEEPAKSVEAKVEGQGVASLPPDSTGIGRLRWPVQGRIVSAFGSPGAAGDGIDIAVPEGTPIKAAENGVVIYAGDGLKEFGKTVLVRHEDGLVTVYGYASDIKVERGDTVKRGQVIASSGMTGSADRPKLHFEVRKDAAPVDPTKYLG